MLVSTGGGDWTHPRGEAAKRRRRLPRLRPKAVRQPVPARRGHVDDVRLRRPRAGPRVLNVAVPLAAEGVTVIDNVGHPGDARHREQRHRARGRVRPGRAGAREPALRRRRPAAAGHRSIAFPIISACLPRGGRGGLRRRRSRHRRAARADDPLVQRQVGLMRHQLQVAEWALDGALGASATDPAPSRRRCLAVMLQSRDRQGGIEVCDLAMDVAGGPAFFKGSVIERALPGHPGREVPPAHAGEHPPRVGAGCARGAGAAPVEAESHDE